MNEKNIIDRAIDSIAGSFKRVVDFTINNLTLLGIACIIIVLSGFICFLFSLVFHIDTVLYWVTIVIVILLGLLGYFSEKIGAKIVFYILLIVFLLGMIDIVTDQYIHIRRSAIISWYKEWDNNGRKNYKAGTDQERKILDQERIKEDELTKENSNSAKKGTNSITLLGEIIESNNNTNFLIDSIKNSAKKKDQERRKTIESKPVKDEMDTTNGKVESVNISFSESFSYSGTTEVLFFKASGSPVKTSIIYLAPGQRFRVKSTTGCLLGTSKTFVEPGVWTAFQQTVKGALEIYGVDSKGSIEIQVL